MPESLLESELFGHGRGAFTGAVGAKPGKFELADGGTILLDEIGEMPLHLQPKLLRALQEREVERLGESHPVHVDIRVIATTNVSLATMVERGDFRGDLFYRLNVIPLSLPPASRAPGRHFNSCPPLCGEICGAVGNQAAPASSRVPQSPADARLAWKRAGAGEFHAPGSHIERNAGSRRSLLRDGVSGSFKSASSRKMSPIQPPASPFAKSNGCTWRALWLLPTAIERTQLNCWASACEHCVTKSANTVFHRGGMHSMSTFSSLQPCRGICRSLQIASSRLRRT